MLEARATSLSWPRKPASCPWLSACRSQQQWEGRQSLPHRPASRAARPCRCRAPAHHSQELTRVPTRRDETRLEREPIMFGKFRRRKRYNSGFRHKEFTSFGGGCSWEQRGVRHKRATKCNLGAQNLRHRRRLDDSVDDPPSLKLCHCQLIHQFLLCSKKMKSGAGLLTRKQSKSQIRPIWCAHRREHPRRQG